MLTSVEHVKSFITSGPAGDKNISMLYLCLTIFTRPANTMSCFCFLKVYYAIKNITGKGVICNTTS